jgi:hypothetical protein
MVRAAAHSRPGQSSLESRISTMTWLIRYQDTGQSDCCSTAHHQDEVSVTETMDFGSTTTCDFVVQRTWLEGFKLKPKQMQVFAHCPPRIQSSGLRKLIDSLPRTIRLRSIRNSHGSCWTFDLDRGVSRQFRFLLRVSGFLDLTSIRIPRH